MTDSSTKEDPVLIALRDFMEQELAAKRECYSTRAERFRAAAAEAHTDWRLRCIPAQPNGAAVMIFLEGIAEILRLRLWIAYMPLLQGLQRIENRINILATLREDPYSPPPKLAGYDKIQTRNGFEKRHPA